LFPGQDQVGLGRVGAAGGYLGKLGVSQMLKGRAITKRFGGLTALSRVDFQVEDTEIVGLIGPNGSGKTTLFNVISGFLRPETGEIHLDQHRLDRLPPYRIVRLGIGRTFQIVKPLEESMIDLKKVGIELVINEKYNLPLPDATPLVLKAKQMNCDILFSNGFFDDGVLTLKAAKALDYNPKVIVQGIGSVIPAWVKELGKDGDYVISGTPIFNKLKFPGNDRLNQVVKERFNLSGYPLYFGFGYQWMWTLAQGVAGAGTLDQTKIRDWLKRNAVMSLVGPLKFDNKGLPKPYNFLTQLIDGKVEVIWPKDQQSHAPVFPRPAWKK